MSTEETVSHESLKYSSKESGGQQLFNYIVTFFVAIIAVVILIFGLYYWRHPEITDSGILAAVLLPVSILLLVLAVCIVYFTNHHKRYEYQFELNRAGIFEQKLFPKKNKVEESHISFEAMDKLLIGNYVTYKSIHVRGESFSHYQFGVLLIVMHKDGYFFKQLFDQEELDVWLTRFIHKAIPISYTDYNLSRALLDYSTHTIDFNDIDAMPWEEVEHRPIIGHSAEDNPYEQWESEDIVEIKEQHTRQKTKQAEKQIYAVLFIYGIFVGGLFFQQLLHNDFEFTSILFVFSFLINILIAVIGIYWRSFTKWYLPFQQFLVVLIGNSIGLFILSFFINAPTLSIFGHMIAFNIVLLFIGWIPVLIIIKGSKMIFKRVNKVELEKR